MGPRSWLVALGMLSLPACIEYTPKGEPPVIEGPSLLVDPESVDFGVLEVGEASSAVVTMSNVGDEALHLASLTIAGSGAFTVTTTETSDTLEPGESTEAIVTFSPLEATDAGALRIDSDDPLRPEVDVPLTGALDTPMLVFSPDPVDFGTLPVGATDTVTVTMSNAGAATLHVDSMMLSGEAFEAELPLTPLVLEPGDATTFDVSFDASVAGAFDGRVWADTDTLSGSESLPLAGAGSDGPIAVCSVDPNEVSTHDELPTWYGSESYDPSGAEIVRWTWALITRPSGSSASMPGGTADRRDFEWDLAGTYIGRLTVENEYGQVSDPCLATLNAVPSDDFWVEMYWTESGDDMDLHVLAPGGSKWSSLDCHWQNCVGDGLNWGDRASSDDDPSLDLDDIPGVGPENIRIADPADGEYTVLVHDYSTSRYRAGNDVTVNIYVGGVLVWSDVRTMEGEDEWESFAYVSFPDGTVTGL